MPFDRVELKPSRKPFSKPAQKPTEPRLPAEELDTVFDIALRLGSLDHVATPLRFIWRDVEIRILEVTSSTVPDPESGELKKVYFVTLQLKYRNKLTKPFTLDCRDVADLIQKLRVEIYRLKSFSFLIPDTAQHL